MGGEKKQKTDVKFQININLILRIFFLLFEHFFYR